MYKTIRQGENSLQYTILPQQDEGRSGGPSVGHRRAGGQRSGGSRRKSILAYIGLFFVCAIITFAILIPLMVTSDLMPTPTAWFYRNQKGRDFRKMSVDGRNGDHIIKGTPLRTTVTAATTSTSTTTTATTTTTTEKPSTKAGLRTDVLTVTEFENLYKDDKSLEQLNGNLLQGEIIPTTTMGGLYAPLGLMNLPRSRLRTPTLTTTTTTVRPTTKNYPKHFSLQKHEKVSGSEVQAERKAIQVNTNTEDMAQVHQNWLQSHWSYVDPYLQWRVS